MDNVSRETNKKIKAYYEILSEWNKVHNLIQSDQLGYENFLNRHLGDAYFLSTYLDREKTILDVGSGNGIPGVVLSILGFNVDLCEILTKKKIFLKYLRSELTLSFEVHENAFEISKSYDYVVSRAFTSLSKLLVIQKNVSRETSPTVGLFLKGKTYLEEITEAQKEIDFSYEVLKKNDKTIIKTILN